MEQRGVRTPSQPYLPTPILCPQSADQSPTLAPTLFPASPPDQLRFSQLLDLVLWLLGRRRRLRVVGESMVPLLRPGEEVLINPRSYGHTPPQPGDLVVAEHPGRPGLELIKWVVYGQGDDYFIAGINLAASTDSRSFGLVHRKKLLGKVVCRFP